MQIISFALLGLGSGAIYALVAQGVVLIYRGSGVLNFAQGALVMFGAYAFYELTTRAGLPPALAIPVTILLGAVLGALLYFAVIAPMRHSSPLARVVATLGIVVVLQSCALLIYGPNVRAVPSFLPTTSVRLTAQVHVGLDRIILLAIGASLSLALWVLYRYTTFGRVTAAVAENQFAAATLGHSPDRIATLNWAIGSALAALAGALIAPITFLDTSQLVLLVVPAMAASLVGAFRSFPVALAAGLGIGVIESLIQRYVTAPGWVSSVPFVIVILALIVRGKSLPVRGFLAERLPAVGRGRVRPIPVALTFIGLASLLLFVVNGEWAAAITVAIAITFFCLSVIVITGYAGQLSLAQYVVGGLGAFVFARMASSWHTGFLLALIGSIVVAVVAGVLVAVPSLRVRGQNLAIASLGMAVVVFSLILTNPDYSGSVAGIAVPTLSIFGWSIDAFTFPGRYAFVSLTILFLCGLAVANIRRGTVGRRMLAVRSNERAAASLGVNVAGAKIYAFAVGSALAAIGGMLYANLQFATIPSQFSVLSSINIVTVTVVGGVGYIGGAVVGALLVPGGPLTLLLRPVGDINEYLPLVGGLYVLYVLRSSPDGAFKVTLDQVRLVGQKLGGLRRLVRGVWQTMPALDDSHPAGPTGESVTTGAPARSIIAIPGPTHARAAPKTLAVDGLRVAFGGVVAVNDITLQVEPGQIHGLIGPNGAGKTTFIDATTGFVRPTSGHVRLDDVDLTGWSARRIARVGLVRSFQSVELFDDLTVRENLAVACDDGSVRHYLTDLLRPGQIRLTETAQTAIEHFELSNGLARYPTELSFGRRRLLAIARAVAARPSILLLDEPAAGLDDAETDELAELIRSLAHEWGIGILLVEHDIDLVLSVCDTLTVLTQGSVLARGGPTEIRSNPAVLEAYLGTRSDHPTKRDVPGDKLPDVIAGATAR